MPGSNVTRTDVQVAVYEFVHMMSESHIALDDYSKDLRLGRDLRFDSLDLIDLAMSLEEEFFIELPEDFPDEDATLGGVIESVYAVVLEQR